jgi:hypothetical protein
MGLAVPGIPPYFFGPSSEDGHVIEMEGGIRQAEKRGAFLPRLYEEVAGVGARDGQDDAGEAGARAHIDDALARRDIARQQTGQGVEVVLDGNVGGVGDSGEACACVVLQQEPEVDVIGGDLLVPDLDAEMIGAVKEGTAPGDVARHVG